MKREITDTLDALDVLRQQVERLNECDPVNDRLAMSIMYQALRRCRGVEGLSPDARKQVSAAIDVGATALFKRKAA